VPPTIAARDPEQKPRRLSPRHLLLQEAGGENGGQHRICADDQRRQTGRYAAQADVVEPEIERIVEDPEQREHRDIAATEMPGRA
jgi:hypothetical protein